MLDKVVGGKGSGLSRAVKVGPDQALNGRVQGQTESECFETVVQQPLRLEHVCCLENLPRHRLSPSCPLVFVPLATPLARAPSPSLSRSANTPPNPFHPYHHDYPLLYQPP